MLTALSRIIEGANPGGGPVPWALEIHVIDVGVGDSTLIIARGADPNYPAVKSLLIDGGTMAATQWVQAKVTACGLATVDTILVSHFDEDHSMGIAGLLLADNLWHLADTIAEIAATNLPGGMPREQTVAQATAQATAVMLGAWGSANHFQEALNVGAAAVRAVPANANDAGAQRVGLTEAENPAQPYPWRKLIRDTQDYEPIARMAGTLAANNIGGGNVRASIRTGIFNHLGGHLPAMVDTAGAYRNTKIIDIGTVIRPDQDYVNALKDLACINNKGTLIEVPRVNREIISIPALGDEVMWPPLRVPPHAPYAIVVSTPDISSPAPTGTAWQGIGQDPSTFNGGTTGNCVSIGIVLVFGNFTFFTAGDLPSQGEDLIGTALRAHPLPDGMGHARAAAIGRISNLKCSHHGASASTSANFLSTIRPVTATLSCGNKHDHPTQDVIDRLMASPNIDSFWFTNCLNPRVCVPVSNGQSQLGVAGLQGWVAGDNNPVNNAVGRNRGDIRLDINQAQSTGAGVPSRYRLTFWCGPVPFVIGNYDVNF